MRISKKEKERETEIKRRENGVGDGRKLMRHRGKETGVVTRMITKVK